MKVVITGTSRGIGKAVAEKYLNEGHIVLGIDVAEQTINNPNYFHFVADVSKADELPKIPGAEIVIANAGVQTDTEKDIEVNMYGVVNTVEKYAMQENIKSVIITASVSATNGAEFSLYVASKGALLPYMKKIAQQIGMKYNATCNSISPGGVTNELNSHILENEKLYTAALNETILGKWSSVEELADWYYFLGVTNKSMTGQDLIIDNGETVKTNFIW